MRATVYQIRETVKKYFKGGKKTRDKSSWASEPGCKCIKKLIPAIIKQSRVIPGPMCGEYMVFRGSGNSKIPCNIFVYRCT